MTDAPFEFYTSDSTHYNLIAIKIATAMREGDLAVYGTLYSQYGLADMGYATYLSIIYLLTNNSILLARFVKALLSAYTCILMYKLSIRNFGESTGRIAAVFCMLMPNLIYYCGMHLKETEMVFLLVLFVERCDYILHTNIKSVSWLLFAMVIGLALFSFRTALGAVAFLALFVALTLTSKRMISVGKKIIFVIIGVAFIGLMFSDEIVQETEKLMENSIDGQTNRMIERSKQKGGNIYAQNASTIVFAPLIFTIPFPSLVETEGQENQRMIHGGNYVKNITSFFTIFALILLLLSGDWRKCVLPIAVMGGYLVVIAFSAFAHSERFHLPVLPLALMFAAYGISQLENKHKKWFNYWLIFIFIAIIGWSFIKLSGRGLA